MGRSSEGLHRGGKKSQERGKKRLHIEYEHACTSYKAPMTYDEVHKSRKAMSGTRLFKLRWRHYKKRIRGRIKLIVQDKMWSGPSKFSRLYEMKLVKLSFNITWLPADVRRELDIDIFIVGKLQFDWNVFGGVFIKGCLFIIMTSTLHSWMSRGRRGIRILSPPSTSRAWSSPTFELQLIWIEARGSDIFQTFISASWIWDLHYVCQTHVYLSNIPKNHAYTSPCMWKIFWSEQTK